MHWKILKLSYAGGRGKLHSFPILGKGGGRRVHSLVELRSTKIPVSNRVVFCVIAGPGDKVSTVQIILAAFGKVCGKYSGNPH
jgi:hypothetical protein